MRKDYSARSLNLSRLPICFEAICKVIKYSNLTIRKGRGLHCADTEPMEALKGLSQGDLPVWILFQDADISRGIALDVSGTMCKVEIWGFEENTYDEIHNIIEKNLNLQAPTEEEIRGYFDLGTINDMIWRVYGKIDELSKEISTIQDNKPKPLRCFVSFRFDDHSKALAFELREFMELVGLEFVSGLGFEPRSVSQKVLERLSRPLDIFVVIFSSSGDSSWLNQEIGVARAKNLPILVLKEDGSDANPGILGDIEYMVFPRDNISKAFIGVLQAISYLKNICDC